MNVIRLRTTDDQLFPVFERLYRISFPEYEQRTFTHHAKALTVENCFINCYQQQDGQFIGFVVYWEFAEYIYIEHYAISDNVRGQGYGTLLLRELVEQTDKIVVLEIDPVIDEISRKRLRFYLALGFVENRFNHVHPPYQPKFNGHNLRVLSSGRELTEAEHQRFCQDLVDVVMVK